MNTKLSKLIASYKRRGPGMHTSLLVVYHSVGVYVHHKQAWENNTPGRESPAFKADWYSMLSLIPCGGVERCLCAHAARLCPVAILRMTGERLCNYGRTTTIRRKRKYLEKTVPQCHFVHYEFHMVMILGVCPGPSDDRPETNRMSYGAAYLLSRISATVYCIARNM
jgi:hypothetical protein